MTSDARPHLAALTSVRFFAAAHVVLFHTVGHFSPALLALGPSAVDNILSSGYVGVSLFFVLSGFILAYNYVDGNGAFRGTRRSFWWARFARIYPVYLVGLVLDLPRYLWETYAQGAFLKQTLWIGAVGLATLTLVQAWIPLFSGQLNPPGWSLAAEAFFYLVFPLLIPILARWRVRTLLIAWLGVWFASLLSAGWYECCVPHIWMWTTVFRFLPIVRFPEFFLGVLLARLWSAGAFRTLQGRQTGNWLLLAGSVALLAILSASPQLPFMVLHNSLLSPLFALIIVLLAGSAQRPSRALSWRPLVRLGESSYALYILHYPVGLLFFAGTRELGLAEGSLWITFAYLATVVAISLAVHRWVERPARQWLRSYPARRPRHPAEAESMASSTP